MILDFIIIIIIIIIRFGGLKCDKMFSLLIFKCDRRVECFIIIGEKNQNILQIEKP